MVNFFEIIKMANFCVIEMANFFYENGEFRLLKWRTSFRAFSQNDEFSGFVIECIIRFTLTQNLIHSTLTQIIIHLTLTQIQIHLTLTQILY